MTDYPEHDKLAKIKDQSQTIGEFLDWAEDTKGIELTKYHSGGEGGRYSEARAYYQTIHNKQGLLAEFFGIDQQKLAEEKDQMLAAMRELNDAAQPS